MTNLTVCYCRLDGSLTNYGCESELEHFAGYGFDPNSADDCYSMSEVISARGWQEWPGATYEHEYKRESAREYFANLHALGRRILDTAIAKATTGGTP